MVRQNGWGSDQGNSSTPPWEGSYVDPYADENGGDGFDDGYDDGGWGEQPVTNQNNGGYETVGTQNWGEQPQGGTQFAAQTNGQYDDGYDDGGWGEQPVTNQNEQPQYNDGYSTDGGGWGEQPVTNQNEQPQYNDGYTDGYEEDEYDEIPTPVAPEPPKQTPVAKPKPPTAKKPSPPPRKAAATPAKRSPGRPTKPPASGEETTDIATPAAGGTKPLTVQPVTPVSVFGGVELEEDADEYELSREDTLAAEAMLRRISDDECSEVIGNGPSEVLVKIKGQRFQEPAATFKSAVAYHEAINKYILPHMDTVDRIDGTNMLIEGQLELPSNDDTPPTLARVHLLLPPLVPHAKMTVAKKSRYAFTLDGIAQTGAMTQPMADFLKAAAHARLTCVVSGVTGAGKTTLLQSMTQNFDMNDRIIVIEDTPELRLTLADVVHLNSTTVAPDRKTDQPVTMEWLVRQSQRMRGDRVIIGEVRGAEMYDWLIVANSGAEGSLTTVHADTPRRALDKMLALASRGAGNTAEITLRREIAATVHLIVQAGLIDGKHVITHIEEISNMVRQDTGVIATTTLFAYNRARGVHEVLAAPSDEMKHLITGRGVQLQPGWFPRTPGGVRR
jgi:Flp pilus assembly CpaF family ATPase